MEPISAGVVLSSIGSAFRFADLALQLAEVGRENEVFVRTIQVVREDLNEVSRLLSIESVRVSLASIPGKLPWIRGAVTNTKTALNDIGEAVERVRIENQATGSVKFETRVRWILSDRAKVFTRTSELSICHQQLSNVLNYLVRLEDVPTESLEPPAYQDATYFDDILVRHRGRSFSKVSQNIQHNHRRSGLVEPPAIVEPECTVDIGEDTKQKLLPHVTQYTIPTDVTLDPQSHMRTFSHPRNLPGVQTSRAQSTPMLPHHSLQHEEDIEGLTAENLERLKHPSKLSRSRSAVELDSESRRSEAQDLSLVTRMRSQKQIMALLGSIET